MPNAVALSREPKAPSNRGLILMKSNADLEQEKADRQETEKAQNDPFINSLAGVIKNNWEVARFARNTIEERLIDGLRRRNGEYSPEKLAMIRQQGGSEIYMMLTSIKCRAAESWINDILFPAGDKPWEIESSPIPDLDPDTEEVIAEYVQREAEAFMQQNAAVLPMEALQERFKQLKDDMEQHLKKEAEKLAGRMDDKIHDQTVEGNWEPALKQVIKDVVTYPAGILKGPIIRRRKSLKWEQAPNGWKPIKGEEYRMEWARTAPFDLYPSPSSKDTDDGYLFERHRLRRADLVAMKGVPGYDSGAIDLVLEQYGTGGLREWLWRDQERAWLEKRPNEWLNYDDTMDALEFWGSVSGKLLVDWGMPAEKVPDLNQEYEINAWVIGNYVIRAVLNEDPLGRRPYHKCSYEEIPGAFWGLGVPELMKDVQDVCNAAARSLVNNMAIASGPQVEVHTDRLAIGEDITGIGPWKIWQTVSDPHGTSNNPAVRFHDVSSSAEVLMAVYEKFSGLADEYTGIPKYTYGEGGKGIADNASALSMLMSSASRGIKMVIGNLDRPIEGSIKGAYIHNMLYDEDESIKGDLKPVAKGSKSLIAKEQQMIRRGELLQSTNNPVDMSIMGIEGRSALLREQMKSFDIPVDDVIPGKEEIVARVKQEMMAALPPPPGGGQARTLDPAGNPVSGQDTAAF